MEYIARVQSSLVTAVTVAVSNQMSISSLSHKGKEAAAKDPYEILFYALASITIDSKLWKNNFMLDHKEYLWLCNKGKPIEENTQSQL